MAHKQPTKATVHYRPSQWDIIKVGCSATVFPVDHTSPWVSNTKVCFTSAVQSLGPGEGEFETMNSIYKPKQENTDV